VRNGGALPGLADDDVVELPARITAAGAEPLAQPPLAPELLGLVQHVAAYERIAARAAVERSPELAQRALLTHPLIAQWGPAEEVLQRLVDADPEHLGAFGRASA
jgi:6-phospho-beta-glucosidase